METIGISGGELVQLVVLAAVLLVGLFLLRLAFKLTATLFRLGCVGILLIVAAVFVIHLFSNGG